jgi:hypothetical protein
MVVSMSRVRTIGVAAAAVLIVTAGCGTSADERGQLDPTLSAVEAFRAGSADGRLVFDQVWDMAFSNRGDLFVLDAPRSTITVFDSVGGLVERFGRRGSGPGEYSFPSALGWLADTLVVLDRRAGRFTLAHQDGGTVDVVVPRLNQVDEATGLPADLVALLPGRVLLVRSAVPAHLAASGAITEVPYWVQAGAMADTIARLPVRPTLWIHNPESANPYSGRYMAQPFVAEPAIVVSALDSALIVAVEEGDAVRVSKLSVTGDTAWSIGLESHPNPVNSDVVDQYVFEQATEFSRSPAAENAPEGAIRDWIRNALIVPEHMPALSGLLCGARGTIWVRRAALDGAAEWVQLDRRGEVAGTLREPSGFQALAGRKGGLAGIVRDELDVQTVVVYRVSADSSGPSG